MARLLPLAVLATSLIPAALAWGALGHEAVAYVATDFVSPETETYMQQLLGDTSADYLASVASWADSYRYTREGRFSASFHFIDAHDDPPHSCGVDLDRDCGPKGCIVTALANYTSRMLQSSQLSVEQSRIAAKMVIHFVGDIGQPLHCENLDGGGNGIAVEFNGTDTNLHAVWDTSIPQSISGGKTLPFARKWASELSTEIQSGDFESSASGWVSGLSLEDTEGLAVKWATESNAYVCTVVLPEGRDAVENQDISGDYTTNAQPTVNEQIAKQGYRLAKWLDAIVAQAA